MSNIETHDFFGEDLIKRLAEKPVMPEQDPCAFENPSKSLQEQFVGVSFEHAFRDAAKFLNYGLSQTLNRDGSNDFAGRRILDFGCGWGRMLRVLRASEAFAQAELYGSDVHAGVLDVCRRSLPNTFFSQTQPYPPSIYRSGIFDLIYAFSVFSHLSEKSNILWGGEFARILKPGGYVFLTTQPRAFIQFCNDYRTGARPIETLWHKSLSLAFAEPDCEQRYDAGELLYAPTGGMGDASDYGEAAVPRGFFEKQWGKLGLELVDWHDEGGVGQVVVTLRKF